MTTLPLESRQHLSATSGFVGWINSARANPAQACADVGVTLNQGLPAGTISETPKQPLVVDARLTTAAQKQATLILDTDTLSHLLNGTPQERAAAEGYRANHVRENAGVTISGAVYSDPQAVLYRQHQQYLIEPGHRAQLFDPDVCNIGVGTAIGYWGDSPAIASSILFASRATSPAPRLFYRFGLREPGTVLE